ncbi:MAG TPA: methylated-DNA--[protein]-cysteine S-methyltransferase [Ktedonobacterales bacterium]|nr:methylated-DNA--[protein]-cysteine S-methyltransferase [Ktedonobacterales bacterium]
MEQKMGIAPARALLRALRTLKEAEAPSTLLTGVLRELRLGDAYFDVETAIGRVFIAHNARGISAVQRAETADEFEQYFRVHFGRAAYADTEPSLALERELRHALSGGARSKLHFDLGTLTEFERAVLLKALEIPRGEVRPYGWIAREIGRPKAVRAVGSALAHNPVPVLIPCHRVVRSDGQLGQYSMGGTSVKRALLHLEGADVAELEELAGARVRYLGSDTTHVYCLPACHSARRITPQHRVSFQSAADAAAAGYHPCKNCRPA